MADTTLTVEPRTPAGSRAAGRLRAEERIPAVIYGQGTQPQAVVVGRRDLRIALGGPAGVNAVLQLQVGGAKAVPAVVKELQRHPVKRTVQHVDFLVVNMNEAITVEVALEVVGESEQVKNLNGMIDPQLTTLTVEAKPGNIPTSIVVDVSSLAIGESVRISDITLPDGVTTSLDPDTVLVAAVPTRATLAAQQAAEGGAPAAE